MKNRKKIISIVLGCVAVFCAGTAVFLLCRSHVQNKQSEEEFDRLRKTVTEETVGEGATAHGNAEDEDVFDGNEADAEATVDGKETASETGREDGNLPTGEAEKPVRVSNPYRENYLENPDMAAWLQIPGTLIDYPVMWTPRDENYYLLRDFQGNDNQNGCLILDTDSCLDPLSTNLIIHGHNMRSGAMFGNLTDYEDENYYKDHTQIILYTPECQRNYEVIAVFRSQVFKKSDNVFKYYKFFQADSEEEFDDFYENIKEMSLYDTGVTAQFGDHFLTLSTCVYHVKNGRFVVVAREVEPGDYYLPIVEK